MVSLLLLPTAAHAQAAAAAAAAAATQSSYSWITAPFVVSTTIALIALFRPNIERVLRKWRNRVEVFPLQRIEVGFSNFGPILGFVGSVAGSPSDQFIRSISIQLVREGDNLTHTFGWTAFRQVTFAPPEMKDLRVAMGFRVAAGDSVPFNIAFVDEQTRQRVEEHLLRLRQGWTDHLRTVRVAPGTQIDARAEWANWNRKSTLQADVYAEIVRLFYWDEGTYKLTLEVKTWEPTLAFRFKFRFSLSPQQAADLRLSLVGAMELACELPGAHALFLWPAIETDK